ncbi:MAG: hypothetical protein ABIJ59_14385 [Pseudomonadota bacterium]
MPTGKDLDLILKNTNLSKIELMLLTESYNHEIKSLIAENAQQIGKLLSPKKEIKESQKDIKTLFETELGKLYQCDCLDLLKTMESDSVDLVFADPPFLTNGLAISSPIR